MKMDRVRARGGLGSFNSRSVPFRASLASFRRQCETHSYCYVPNGAVTPITSSSINHVVTCRLQCAFHACCAG